VRALVTGAGGFVGIHLVRHLAAQGDDVVELEGRVDGIDITDPGPLTEAIVKAEPEAIYHLAGASDVGGSWVAPRATFMANAVGTLNVLEAAREAGAERILAVTSADVYGRVTEDELPLGEDQPLRPVSPYAASKVAADALAQQAWLGHRQPVIRVRAFNHLGPGQSDHFVAPSLAARIAGNERDGGDQVPIGNLTPRRDVTDVRDVVRAYRLLVEHGTPGDVYNVCSGHAVAVQEIAEQLLGMAQRPMHLVTDPDLQRPVDIPVLVGDNSKLAATTGWSPTIPLETTLADVLADWRARLAATDDDLARPKETRQ
jgi:GDP-4-dehydro-6-deoxy-D-mannose reductase